MNYKSIKSDARRTLKAHYFLLVAICVLYSFIGVDETPYYKYLSGEPIQGVLDVLGISTTNAQSLYAPINEAIDTVDENLSSLIEPMGDVQLFDENGDLVENIGPVELGTDDGVFADIVNKITDRNIITMLMNGIKSIVKSDTIANTIMIILALLVFGLFWLFVIRVYKVVAIRLFLESRIYRQVPIRRGLFLFRCRRWLKTAWTLSVTLLFQILWSFTIVGGVIKYFSYILVPYILAENPNIPTKQAIALSERMMKGHKWELFKLLFSLIGWWLLNIATMGLLGIFYYSPYKICIKANYYALLREEAILFRLEGHEYLNDRYLYEICEENKLREAYSDVYSLIDNPPEKPTEQTGVLGFISRNFGVVLFSGKIEKERIIYVEKMTRIEGLKAIRNRQVYPSRLFPMPRHPSAHRLEYFHYMRRYSIWSIILMFFSFSFIGWLWEVGMHLVEDGRFVNRGMLTGPWLPIYGSGGLMVLLFLYRIRKNPIKCVGITFVLCGILEYSTAWFLDYKFGMKWWDYTGYFLNIQGRICAEGLVAFTVGAIFVIYILAPLLDNFLTKIRLRVIIPACAILVSIFIMDMIYTKSHPNIGEGITDYPAVENISKQNSK